MNDDEGTSNVCDANSTDMMDDVKEADSDANPPADQLERCGRWLSSIPRDDVQELRQTQEYHAFLRAFERLGNAHRRVISLTRSSGEMEDAPNIARLTFTPEFYVSPTPNNFLQHLTAEDVVLRIFEFLECHSLIRTASTCSRFRQLAHCSATQRTCDVAHSRQLNSVMQLLRAKEQIDGVGCGIHHSHVRVPILLLSRRVLVTNAGDPDYNGVYFCTGSNGNGFVFTKPRFPERRVQRILRQRQHIHHPPLVEGMHPFPQLPDPLQPLQEGAALVAGPRMEEGPTARFESEVAQPGQLLRCVIAKRFSNEVRTQLATQ